MKLRARHIHAGEVFIDNVLGLVINFGLVILVYNYMLGQDITIEQNLWGSIIFFIAAYIRKYTIRRYTSGLIEKVYSKRKAQEDAELQKQLGTN